MLACEHDTAIANKISERQVLALAIVRLSQSEGFLGLGNSHRPPPPFPSSLLAIHLPKTTKKQI